MFLPVGFACVFVLVCFRLCVFARVFSLVCFAGVFLLVFCAGVVHVFGTVLALARWVCVMFA